MSPKAHRLILFLVLLVMTAAIAQAQANAIQYTVTLENGTTFETRYSPVEAEWSSNHSMLLTDTGNWIAIPNDEITDIISHAEESGFGFRVDTTTLYLGWSPNDLADAEDANGEARYDLTGADAGASGGGNYSIDQFLNVNSTAPSGTGSGGGIPVGILTEPSGD